MFGDGFKNFAIHFNASNERGSFSAGDNMNGHITFELSKEAKINSLTLLLRGSAKVQWNAKGNYTEKLNFFNSRHIVLPRNVVGHTVLQPGAHVYPFTCQIPQGDFPSTFHGFNGNITYSLKVEIHRPWHIVKEFETEFNFVSHIDANHPQLLAPLAGSNSKTVCCLCWASGLISMNIRLEKKGFVPGECVKIVCELSNGSSRTVTPKATLSQKLQLFSGNQSGRRTLLKDMATVHGTPVSPGSSEVYSEMILPIPAHTALTISNCSILEADYTVDVSLRIRGSHDLKVLFPVILCDAPPPYQDPYQDSRI